LPGFLSDRRQVLCDLERLSDALRWPPQGSCSRGVTLSACARETRDSTVATEQGVTQDINAVRGRSTTLPAVVRLVQQPSNREPSISAPRGPHEPLSIVSGRASVNQPPKSANPHAGHHFAVGTCSPCHIVSPHQKLPSRFADAPHSRAIANAPRTTVIRLNIWLTNPHPRMPKLVLYPQEAADVIAYIPSLRERR